MTDLAEEIAEAYKHSDLFIRVTPQSRQLAAQIAADVADAWFVDHVPYVLETENSMLKDTITDLEAENAELSEALKEIATELTKCIDCGRVHDRHSVPGKGKSGKPYAVSWASLDDGHTYRPLPAVATAAKALRASSGEEELPRMKAWEAQDD